MALNADAVGKTYPASEPYQVGREKLREFARAVGDDNPLCHDVAAASAAGYPDIIAPPTFAIALSFNAAEPAITDPEIGLDFSRVVHGEQRFEYSRPITAGDELVVTTVIEAARTVAGNDMLTTKGVISTTEGEHVCTSYSMLLARAVEEA